MAVRNGTDILLKLATSLVDGTVSKNIDFSRDMIDVTTKDSTDNAKEFIPGEKGATIGVEGKWNESTSNYDVQDLIDAYNAGTSLAFIYGGTTTGDLVLTGNGYISAFSWSAPKNAESTWSATIQVTGAVTRTTAA